MTERLASDRVARDRAGTEIFVTAGRPEKLALQHVANEQAAFTGSYGTDGMVEPLAFPILWIKAGQVDRHLERARFGLAHLIAGHEQAFALRSAHRKELVLPLVSHPPRQAVISLGRYLSLQGGEHLIFTSGHWLASFGRIRRSLAP